VFGSKVLVLLLVCYKLTITPPSKNEHNVVIISKKTRRGRAKIKGTGNGKRFPRQSWRNCCQSMAESTAAQIVIPM
jgi:hypothetical protein